MRRLWTFQTFANPAVLWLYHESGWRRYETGEFHRLSLLADPPVAAPPETPRWMPIASAPKDADVLLLYRDGCGVQPGYWDDDYWRAVETQSLTGGNMEPTHWMPLPDQPRPHPEETRE